MNSSSTRFDQILRKLMPFAACAAAIAVGVAILATLARPACAADKLRIVASLPDLAAIAREVGGDRVEVAALADPNQDPHHVDARPHLVLKLNRADLLVHAGLELEVGWLPVLIRGARNSRIYEGTPGSFDASTVIQVKDVPVGKVDRTMGDVHPGGNPHYLTDPRNGGLVAVALADRLARLDTVGASAYRSRARALQARAEDLAKREAARFRALPEPRRRVVTYHRSLTYLVDWLGLSVIGTLEPKPGIPPSPAHVASVLGAIRQARVSVIVQEAFYPSRTAQLVASRSGAKLVLLPGFPDFDAGQAYLEYLGGVADKLYSALEGKS